MMVIRGAISSATDRLHLGLTTQGTDPHIFPADRCIWTQTYNQTTREYEISNARLIVGTNTATPPNIDYVVNITDPQLGYIGKSGRFVEIAG